MGEIQLERSFAAISLAAVQIGTRKIGGRYAKRRQAVQENGRGTLRKTDPQALESVDALSVYQPLRFSHGPVGRPQKHQGNGPGIDRRLRTFVRPAATPIYQPRESC